MRKPRFVLERPQALPCGYAPRSMLVPSGNRVVVGCKDGSVTIVERAQQKTFAAARLPVPADGVRRQAVRSLCGHDDRHLLIGRSDGSIDVLDVHRVPALAGDPEPRDDSRILLPPNAEDPEDAVRFIGWLSPGNLLISHRHRGTSVFQVNGSLDSLRPVARVRSRNGDLAGVRIAIQWTADLLFLVTSRAEAWSWDGQAESFAELRLDLWQSPQRPSLLNDCAVIDSEGAPKALLLATDIGVYLVTLSREDTLPCSRLSLTGLGPVCMTLAYSDVGDGYGLLWTADTRGDSHLFWHHRSSGTTFLPSGVVHAGSQAMLLRTSRTQSGSVLFAQARRNDQIVLIECLLLDLAQSRPEPSRLERLRRDTVENMRKPHGVQEEEGISDWPGYAVVANFFELEADREDGSALLQEFLSDPQSEAARQVLATLAEEEIESAVRLWTLTLLGVVNRMPNAREASYLGILHWLRDLEREPQNLALNKRNALARSIQKAIRFSRKWGLFGEANALRQGLVKPIEVLRSQHHHTGTAPRAEPSPDGPREPGRRPEALDLLTYEALLFHRRVDLLHENTRGEMRGRTAWSVSALETAGQRLVAVSWLWGGVEISTVEQRGGEPELDLQMAIVPLEVGESEPYVFEPKTFLGDTAHLPKESWRLKYGYSRAVLLGSLGNSSAAGCYLLTAPALSYGEIREGIQLWELAIGDDNRWEARRSGGAMLSEGESLYCMLELAPGLVLAGLRGRRGVPKVAVLRILADPSGALRVESQEWPLEPFAGRQKARAATTVGAREQNRIWSLASLQPSLGEHHEVAVGCEGGEILRLTLPRQAAHSADFKPTDVSLLAQMNASVQAVAYFSYGEKRRLFAGGVDGSIVAWQQTGTQRGDLHPKLATLWATLERGPITAIHPLSSGNSAERLILAISRSGACVLFDDRPDIEPPAARGEHPQRPGLPGGRRGRFRLAGATDASMGAALASLVFSNAGWPAAKAEIGRFATLLAASESGGLRLFSLHFPRRTPERAHQYERILRLWWQVVRLDPAYQRLRIADAAYQAAPLLPLLVVRWFLDPSWPSDPETGGGNALGALREQRWLLPHYLRPLIDLRAAWDDPTAAPERVGHALESLLRDAWRLNDLDLFQELCHVTLKRANFEIFKAARSSGKAERICALFLQVFEVIERSLPRWLGMPERRESRARIVVAKSLIDGDTFWQVLLRAAEEAPSPGPFRRILERRVTGVRQLVFNRDPIVSLETLRALNLSLIRLCKRLSLERQPEGWTPRQEPSRQEAFWPVFEAYFQGLTYSAARVFRSRLELTDAIAHEYCRTFALAVCACPSAAIRIANRMTETQLISDPQSEQDLARRVDIQFEILKQLGIEVPDPAVQLFRMASRPPEHGLDPFPSLFAFLRQDGAPLLQDPPALIALAGVQNSEDLLCLSRIYAVVRWLTQLADRLSSDARDIDVTAERIDGLKRQIDSSGMNLLATLYPHSVGFWQDALDNLRNVALMDTSGATIRPEVVLKSVDIANWARQQIGELDQRYKDLRIFQPEYPIFREVLSRLERAAREFRQSAAVQKGIALAIFGHHLLEDLDEHVLELEELAQNLDPLMVRGFRDRGRVLLASGNTAVREEPVSRRFASYLLRRAYHAESIPKNLRALHGILDPSQRQTAAAHSRSEILGLAHLFQPLDDMGWNCSALDQELLPDIELAPRELECIGLVFTELDRNYQKHSASGDPKSSRTMQPVLSLARRKPFTVSIRFQFEYDASKLERLRRLRRGRLQQPVEPEPSRKVPSSGAGLYLANLAAAMVGWRLEISAIGRENAEVGLCFCRFRLTRFADLEPLERPA